MGRIQNNNKELLARVSAVNDLIRSNYITPPPEQFAVTQPDMAIKQTMTSAVLSVVTDLLLIANAMLHVKFSTFRLIIPVCLFFCSIMMFAAVFSMKKFRMDVNGQSITIKGRTYSCGEIDCIKGSSMNGLTIVSGGKDIIKFSKALDNCDELIKWARCNHIRIDDDPDADPKKAQNIYMIIAVIVMILAVFIGLYLGLKGKRYL